MVQIIPAREPHFSAIQNIARQTWPIPFKEILSPEQISYMLEMMYSPASLLKQVKELRHVFFNDFGRVK